MEEHLFFVEIPNYFPKSGLGKTKAALYPMKTIPCMAYSENHAKQNNEKIRRFWVKEGLRSKNIHKTVSDKVL